MGWQCLVLAHSCKDFDISRRVNVLLRRQISFHRTCSSEIGAFKLRELSPQEEVTFITPKLTHLIGKSSDFGCVELRLILGREENTALL